MAIESMVFLGLVTAFLGGIAWLAERDEKHHGKRKH